MVNIDRIAEAYLGELGDAFGKKSRKRIDWICNKVEGNKILDIGCSQGITSFLLAKKGKKVIGIDIVQQSIDYANSLLEKDDVAKSNAMFICNDFIAQEFDDTFNTIIVTEVLEHLDNPLEFIKKSYELTEKSGKIIVTVPFGINDHPDHKRTYYMVELLEQLSSYINIEDIQAFCNDDGIAEWIGIEGIKKDTIGEGQKYVRIEEIKELEQHFYSRERMLVNNNYMLTQKVIDSYNVSKKINNQNEIIMKMISSSNKMSCVEVKVENDLIIYDKDKINIDSNRIECKMYIEDEEYISIYEDNLDLEVYPNRIINLNDNIKVEFTGDITGNLDFKLIVVYYSDEKVLSLNEIGIGSNKVISCPASTKAIRLFLSIKGSGSADIHKIKLESLNYKNKEIDIDQLKIACIFDEFTSECYEDMCKLMHIRPNDWKQLLTNEKPDLLMVESAWCGIQNSWNGKIINLNREVDDDLLELVTWCKLNNIPTIFWNKEDPVSFDIFIETAKYFDYIFTTDIQSIDEYKNILNRENVFLSSFAASPFKHNPIKINDNRIDKAFFAGAYYVHFKERNYDFENLFEASKLTTGIDIYDRNFVKENNASTFPEKYKKYIVGKIDSSEIDKVYKGYKIALNVNTVKESRTMFSRRVYELLACGTPIVSSYSKGINEVFDGLIFSDDDVEYMKLELSNLKDNKYYDYKKIKGIRKIFREHTYEHRLIDMLSNTNIKVKNNKKTVSIICFIKNNEDLRHIANIYNNQTYDNKQLILVIDSFENINESEIYSYNFKKIQILNLESFEKSELKLNNVIKSDYIAYMNVENYYGKYYIEDLMNATIYSNADYIGKNEYFKYENSNCKVINNNKSFEYVTELIIDRCLIKNNNKNKWKIKEFYKLSKNKGIVSNFRYGYQLLSIDKYNFIENLRDYEIIEKLNIEV